jgi:hypothetical protein
MPESVTRTKGRGQGYKFDRGGMPAEFGPFIGTVKDNIDPIRAGRLRVYIEQFSGGKEEDETLWRTVSYIPPFYGTTQGGGSAGDGPGTFTGNPQSYGMWFTPPDLGTRVICFFVEGDPNQGYYIGCIPDPGVNHMLPAVGASSNYVLDSRGQDDYLSSATQLPVTEINGQNEAISENPRFFGQNKPIHSVVAGIMFQQGLITDTIRGPITSNAQRESPSAVFGMSTPGRAIYQGGLSDSDIQTQLNSGQIKPQDVKIIARRGGHSIVMDDGDLEGQDNLVRIRTSKGHQITMSDDGDCFYIIHANGQTWLEFGKQGTVDVFSTNSVNIRTQGTINLHADKDINMYAGGSILAKAQTIKMEADATLDLLGTGSLTLYSKNTLGLRSDGTLALKSTSAGSFDGGGGLNLKAGCINLNSGAAQPVNKPTGLTDLKLADVSFQPNVGWTVEYGSLKTIVTRAPTHEPYPYHNQGTSNLTSLDPAGTVPLSAAVNTTLGALADVSVSNPLTADGFLTQSPASIAVGSLDLPQVTGLMAAASQATGQSFDTISEAGIGKFGFTANQLEAGGFLKPGTVQTFLQNPADLTAVLSSPSVWSGREGVNNLGDLLGNESLQDLTQNSLMVGALNGLRDAGVVTGEENPAALGSLVQTATKFGVNDTVKWLQGQAPSNVAIQINATAKDAQYAVNLVDTKLNDLVNTGLSVGGFTNTTSRSSLDQALESIINNPKVPVPDFGSGLYSGLPDSALTYEGDDPVIIERINAERARRGLPPLGGFRI